MRAIRWLGCFGVLAIGLGLAGQAWALPPPMTEQELMDGSILVVDATCVAIECEGPPVQDAQKITTTYVSTLTPFFSYKGGLPGSIQIRGFGYEWLGPEPVGGWHQQPVPEGWVGKLYLVEETDGTYTKVWWNGMEQDPVSSNPLPLPSCAVADPDGGLPDGGTPDGGLPDASGVDAADVDGSPSAPDGAPPDAGPPVLADNGGCSCRTGDTVPSRGPLALLFFAGLLWILGRRRSIRRC